MNHKNQCPKCFRSDFWKTADNRLKCKYCRYIFVPKPNPLNVPFEKLKEIISEFLLEHPIHIILERVNVSKYKLLKVLVLLRELMEKDLPDNIKIMIKTGNSKNLVKKTDHQIIGIFCIGEEVFAKVLPDIEPNEIKSLIKTGEFNRLFPKNWQKSIGLVYKNSLYRPISSNQKKFRVDDLDRFWGYLKRKLAEKGGIRPEKLPLYLGEYVWRYNFHKLTLKEKEERLFHFLLQYFDSQKQDVIIK